MGSFVLHFSSKSFLSLKNVKSALSLFLSPSPRGSSRARFSLIRCHHSLSSPVPLSTRYIPPKLLKHLSSRRFNDPSPIPDPSPLLFPSSHPFNHRKFLPSLATAFSSDFQVPRQFFNVENLTEHFPVVSVFIHRV